MLKKHGEEAFVYGTISTDISLALMASDWSAYPITVNVTMTATNGGPWTGSFTGTVGTPGGAITLYAENFDPVMSRQERLDYHDEAINTRPVRGYVDRLMAVTGDEVGLLNDEFASLRLRVP